MILKFLTSPVFDIYVLLSSSLICEENNIVPFWSLITDRPASLIWSCVNHSFDLNLLATCEDTNINWLTFVYSLFVAPFN